MPRKRIWSAASTPPMPRCCSSPCTERLAPRCSRPLSCVCAQGHFRSSTAFCLGCTSACCSANRRKRLYHQALSRLGCRREASVTKRDPICLCASRIGSLSHGCQQLHSSSDRFQLKGQRNRFRARHQCCKPCQIPCALPQMRWGCRPSQ